MTLLFFDGFDMQDATLKGWSAAAFSSTTVFGTGFACSRSSTSSGAVTSNISITASAKVFVGFAMSTANSVGPGVSLWGDSGATQHLTISTDTTGTVTIRRGSNAGTVLATSAVSVLPLDSTYRYVEVSATISDTVGICEVRVNGTVVVTFTGDTKNAGTNSTIDQVRVGWQAGGANGPLFLFDDFYVCNDLTGVNNTYLGPWVRVQTLAPTGAGSSTQFTPISGSNWSNVNDSPDNTATYNSDTVSGHRDTFALADLTTGTTVIYGVQQVMHARQLDGGTATIKQAQKSGATISYGATQTLSATNTGYVDKYETNPATGVAWTQTDVNALEAGYELV